METRVNSELWGCIYGAQDHFRVKLSLAVTCRDRWGFRKYLYHHEADSSALWPEALSPYSHVLWHPTSLRIKEKLGVKYAIQKGSLWKILPIIKHVNLKIESKIIYPHFKDIFDNLTYVIVNV